MSTTVYGYPYTDVSLVHVVSRKEAIRLRQIALGLDAKFPQSNPRVNPESLTKGEREFLENYKPPFEKPKRNHYKYEKVRASEINRGDTIIENGRMQTVGLTQAKCLKQNSYFIYRVLFKQFYKGEFKNGEHNDTRCNSKIN